MNEESLFSVNHFVPVFEKSAGFIIIQNDIYRCTKCKFILEFKITRNKNEDIIIERRCRKCNFACPPLKLLSLFMLECYYDNIKVNKGASILTEEQLSESPKYLIKKWHQYIIKDELENFFPITLEHKCTKHKLNIDSICESCNFSGCSFCIKEDHNEHKTSTIVDYANEIKVTEKMSNFAFLLRVSLDQNVTIYRQVYEYLSKFKLNLKDYYNTEKEVNEKNEEITNLINEITEAYKRNEIENRFLALLYQIIAELFVKYKFTEASMTIFHNVKHFSNFFLPKVTIPLVNEDCKSIENAKEVVQYSKFVLIHNLLVNTKDTLINIPELQETYRFAPCLLVQNIIPRITRIYGKGHQVRIKCILVYKQNQFLVSSTHSTIKYFKIEESGIHPIMKFKKHSKQVNYLSKGPEGYFYSCSNDKMIIKWKIVEPKMSGFLGKALNKTKLAKYKIMDHTKEVIQVIPLDNNKFASCSCDNTIRIYQDYPEDKQPTFINMIKCEDSQSRFISMVKLNDNRIVTASTDNTLRFWDYSTFSLINGKNVQNVECLSTEGMKICGIDSLIIGGQGKFVLFDLFQHQILYQVNNPSIGSITSILSINEKSIICVDENNFYEFVKRNDALQRIVTTSHLSNIKVGAIAQNGETGLLIGNDKSEIKQFVITLRKEFPLYYE